MRQNHQMTILEKTALISASVGAVFYVGLHSAGATLADATEGPLYVIRVIASVVQAGSFDLVAIATVIGMRAGRRSYWSHLTAWSAAIISAVIALDVSGYGPFAWLHSANALIVLFFMLHLASPIQRSEVARQLRRFRRMARLVRDSRQVRTLTTRISELSASWQAADQARQLADQLRQALTAELTAERAARQGAEALIAELQQALEARPEPAEVEAIIVAAYRLTWEQLEQLVQALVDSGAVSQSTIRRRVRQLAAPAGETTDGSSI